jgi:tetratricopeptide (TPR) repeat protein
LEHDCLAYNLPRFDETGKEAEERRKAVQFAIEPRDVKNPGAVYVEMGERENDAQQLEEVLKLDPLDHLSDSDRGEACTMLGQSEKARDCLQLVTDSEPYAPVYYKDLALALFDLGLCGDSIEVLKRTLKIRPDFLPN